MINNLVMNKEGWVYMLTCLKAYLENGISSMKLMQSSSPMDFYGFPIRRVPVK